MSRRNKMAWLTVAVAALVFLIDAFVPQGVALGIPYAAVVVVTIFGASRRHTIVTALGCSVLVVAGALVSPAPGDTEPWKVVANRALAVLGVWAAAGLVVRHKRLHERQELLAAIVESSEDAILGKTLDGTITSWNRGAERMYGYTAKEAVGQPVAMLVPLEHRAELESILDRVRQGEHVKQFQTIRMTKDGVRLHVSLTISPIRNADGNLVGASAIARDITQRKQAEEKLKSLNDELEQRVRDRTELLKLLSDVSQAANEAGSVRDAVEYTLHRISQYHCWSFGHAFLPVENNPDELAPVESCYEETAGQFESFRAVTASLRLARGQGLPGKAYETGEAQWTTDLAEDLLTRRAEMSERLNVNTAAAFPILCGEEVVGVLEFFSTAAIEPDERMRDTMTAIGTQLGRVVERMRLQQEMTQISHREQRRFGMELHDELGQQLTGTAMLSSRLHRRLRADDSPYAEEAEELAKLISDAQAQVRTLIKGLGPVEIESDGLPAALAELAVTTGRLTGIGCEFLCEEPVALASKRAATQMFYIAREAVNNAVKHAEAKRVAVRLYAESGQLVLRIEDDGVGIAPPTRPPEGVGLRIMRHRAGLIGARLAVTPGARRGAQPGTVVTCQLRISPPAGPPSQKAVPAKETASSAH